MRFFDGAEQMETTSPLKIAVTELGEPIKIFDGDGTEAHPPLWQRQAVAVLPWQISKTRFVIAIYLMSYDATRPLAGSPYRIEASGFPVPG